MISCLYDTLQEVSNECVEKPSGCKKDDFLEVLRNASVSVKRKPAYSKALKVGLKIREVPISWHRPSPPSRHPQDTTCCGRVEEMAGEAAKARQGIYQTVPEMLTHHALGMFKRHTGLTKAR